MPSDGSASASRTLSQEELKAAWKTCIEAFRTSGASALVTGALSRACPLALDSSSLRVGICVGDRMTRENLKRHQREVETRLGGILGIQVSLSFEEISAEAAKNSIAEEEKTRREDREDRLKNECLSSAAVVLARKILGCRVERVETFEVQEPGFDFSMGSGMDASDSDDGVSED